MYKQKWTWSWRLSIYKPDVASLTLIYLDAPQIHTKHEAALPISQLDHKVQRTDHAIEIIVRWEQSSSWALLEHHQIFTPSPHGTCRESRRFCFANLRHKCTLLTPFSRSGELKDCHLPYLYHRMAQRYWNALGETKAIVLHI